MWSPGEQALYWVDLRAPALFRLDFATRATRSWPMPDLCCGVALAADGLLVILRNRVMRFDPATGAMRLLVDFGDLIGEDRLNEARCDRQGALWVGSMRDFGAAISGSLFRVSPDLRIDRVLSGICVPNSLCWSPGGKTLYFADSREGRIRAYDLAADGALSPMRVLSEAGSIPGRPDGATVDADGALWSARVGGGAMIARLDPQGAWLGQVPLPVSNPTSCTLGGPDLRTLFVITARQGLDEAALAAQPLAGHLFACTVDRPGLPEPVFAG